VYSKTHKNPNKGKDVPQHSSAGEKDEKSFSSRLGKKDALSATKKVSYGHQTSIRRDVLSNRFLGGNSHLPATDAEQEANHIGLLLLLDLFDVLEGTHLDGEMKG
jgi:hypothetical protein